MPRIVLVALGFGISGAVPSMAGNRFGAVEREGFRGGYGGGYRAMGPAPVQNLVFSRGNVDILNGQVDLKV